MTRAEFSKPTRRAALDRAQGRCEAVGKMYGLNPGVRCNAFFGLAVEFDHVILEANSHDNSLENCACVCLLCHRIKTRTHDVPLAAKTLRQQDRARGIRGTDRAMAGSRRSPWKRRMDGTVVPR